MQSIQLDDSVIVLPTPLYLVIEDVGWWQGYDGSAWGEPYRNNLPRAHCLADYEALSRLAKKLSMRLSIGMVIGEWDKSNLLRDIPSATWMGTTWNNQRNLGPWLEQAAHYLKENDQYLEIAVHGLCHEYWDEGSMDRSEFHDSNNLMRDPSLIRRHLDAYREILTQNGLETSPRLFIPPALHHSFGNGEDSMQALLHSYGLDYITTRFDRARCHSPPLHKELTWECGVTILERGVSPVPWSRVAAAPVWNDPGPIMALHWGNLLHVNPERNSEIIDAWAALILEKTSGPDSIIAPDLSSCWRQTAFSFLTNLRKEGNNVIINTEKIPTLPCFAGSFLIRILGQKNLKLNCSGAKIMSKTSNTSNYQTIELLPHREVKRISLYFTP